MKQFVHIMNGRGHALMVEGRLDSSELAQYSRDSQSSLASDLASCFASSDVAQSWTALAAKDLEDIEMIEESIFKGVLSDRMRGLADETLRLCGVTDLVAYRAEKERQMTEMEAEIIESHAAEVKEEVVAANLFDFDFQSFGVESVFPGAHIPVELTSKNSYDVELVVDIDKFKKRGKRAPAENQLCWNF